MSDVTYELTVYPKAEEFMDQLIQHEQDESVPLPADDKILMPVLLLTGLMAQFGEEKTTFTKLPRSESDETATYKIDTPNFMGNAIEMLNMFGLITGKEDGRFKSLIIKQYYGENTDFGVVEGKAYKDGQILEGPQTL